MNYSSKFYALALHEALNMTKTDSDIKKCINNFLFLIKKNRDQKKIKNIILALEKIIVKENGGRKILVESARPLNTINEKIVESLIKKTDIVEKKINSDLIAGIKININDELLLDGSFATKIKKILKL